MVRFRDIKHQKRVHPVYAEWERFIKGKMPGFPHNEKPIIGKEWNIYTWDNIRVSLVYLPDYFMDGVDLYEYCGGGLLSDVRRTYTKREAEKEIFQLFKKVERQKKRPKPSEKST